MRFLKSIANCLQSIKENNVAMKVKPGHIDVLRKALEVFLNKDTATIYRDAGLSEKRYRWDALWSVRRGGTGNHPCL